MTRSGNARVAGFSYLAYIALAFPSMLLFGRASGGGDTAAKLASISQHGAAMQWAILLTLLSSFTALALAVTLFALTRDVDRDIAMLGLVCRAGEGITNATFVLTKMELLWVAASTRTQAVDASSAAALGTFLTAGTRAWNLTVGAFFFAVGSTCFCWLLLRGRVVPRPLAWLGLVASALLVLALPFQMMGLVGASVMNALWLPMAAFEIPVGVWWLIRGDTLTPQARLQTEA